MMRYLLLGLLFVVACENREGGSPDGSQEGVVPGDGALPGEGGPGYTVDFVVQGCAERTPTSCSGMVPLYLTFTALLPRKPPSVTWDLGDGSNAEEGLVIRHVYDEPGLYDVSLTVGEGGGTTTELKGGFVKVTPAGAGSPCDDDNDCESGKCACKEAQCAFPVHSGLCLEACELTCSKKDTTCVDLTVKGTPDPAPPWRTHLCLASCSTSAECTRPGFACALAPGVQGWRKVCLPTSLRPVGSPCRTSSGAPDDALCVGSLCLDVGASGYCSWPCKAGTCPEGTRCVRYEADPSAVCLVRCGPGTCQNDPMLACELPGGDGEWSFKVLGSQEPNGTRFCSRKRCAAHTDCGLSGLCEDGFCAPGRE
jgi:PKD repeat protein